MSKRRKVLVIIGLIVLAVVCFFALRPVDEPKYQGRYLSEWVAIYGRGNDRAAAERAVRAIGTNALPYFLKWMRVEVTPWRASLRNKLPSWIADNRTVGRWIYGDALLRPHNGYLGLEMLGTNAFVAIPELEAMMRDPTKPQCGTLAMVTLIEFGEPAIPIFQAVLADPHQAGRENILEGIGMMTSEMGTNSKYLPIFVASLTNDDARVRREATNFLSRIAPEILTNAPAH